MADFESGLPVRSEADGTDERVQTKIVDSSNPDTQQATVDTDSNLHVEAHGNDPAGVDRVLRTSELGSMSVDGEYDASDNTDPSQVGLVSMARNASPTDSQQTQRVTGAISSDTTKRTVDVSLLDEDAEPFSATNPLPVSVADSDPGDEVHDFDAAAAIAKDATDNHDYTVTGGKTLLLKQILASASGKMKVELQIETGVATGVFDSRVVRFNSTASPEGDINMQVPIIVAAGVIVRVIRTNRDNQAQDLYSTIIGIER